MSTKTWIIFAAVCVVLFGGLIVYSQRGRADVSSVKQNSILAASEASGNIADRVDGTKGAKVTLIEYGDFQCPGCGSAHPTVKSLVEKYGDDMAFVFRNYPLTDRHPNARAAAAAAEAAGQLGKYWEMHNLIFESQDEWSDASADQRGTLFKGYAGQVGLNGNTFEKTLKDQSERLNRKISFDQALGRKVKVSGTPTFYLNGTLIDSEAFSSQESFEKILTDEFKKQGVSIEAEN